jgi:hypothetical protein
MVAAGIDGRSSMRTQQVSEDVRRFPYLLGGIGRRGTGLDAKIVSSDNKYCFMFDLYYGSGLHSEITVKGPSVRNIKDADYAVKVTC